MRVFHYCQSITSRDAIGYSTVRLHTALLSAGVESYLVCNDHNLPLAPAGTLTVQDLVQLLPTRRDVIIFHYSFADNNVDVIQHLRAKIILVYHNITPGHFFRDHGQIDLANACDAGRAALPGLVQRADVCIGDSDYNRTDFPTADRAEQTIPVFYNDRFFRPTAADHERFLKASSSGAVNLTFIGRLVPNKRIDNVIRVAGAIKNTIGMTPKLRIFGKIWDRGYFRYLESIVLDLGLEGNVTFEVNQPGSELRAALASSDAFVTMSEHEGFMVPLLEAFTAGCPVVGLKSTAVTETCGSTAALLPTADIEAVAGLAVALKQNRDSRMAMLRSQSRRAQAFAEGRTWNKWRMVLEDFVPQLRNV